MNRSSEEKIAGAVELVLLVALLLLLGVALFKFFRLVERLDVSWVRGAPIGAVFVVAAILTGGGMKESMGSELAFRVSASMACKEALAAGQPFLLDPIMNVELFVPESFMGDVIGDLNARGGKIEAIEPKTGLQVIRAVVPLATMFGYASDLRNASQGRASFTMHFEHYEAVPYAIAEEIIAAKERARRER